MEFLRLGLFCDNCGAEIESRPTAQTSTIVLSGWEEMDHRHTENMQEKCNYINDDVARPYTDCGNLKKYRKLKYSGRIVKDYFKYEMGRRDCELGNPAKQGMGDKYYQGFSEQHAKEQQQSQGGFN
jgi:hypothetical protein